MVKTADIFSLPSDASTHHHDYHQLVLALEGTTAFDIAGLGQQVRAGSGCVVPSTTAHAFAGIGSNRIMVVNLPVQHGCSGEERERIERLFGRAIYFSMNSHLQVLTNALGMELQNHPEDSLLARACGNTLLCALQHHLDLPVRQRTPGIIDMAAIDEYIRLHLHQKISVGRLAGLACLSSSQFHELFKRQTGMTPHQYLLEQRLLSARVRLEEGKSLVQVAELCGFSSQSAFTHAFKRRFDITPARHRRAHTFL